MTKRERFCLVFIDGRESFLLSRLAVRDAYGVPTSPSATREVYEEPLSPIGTIDWKQRQTPTDEGFEQAPVEGENSLLNRFSVDDEELVESYLNEHTGLEAILLEAADELEARFPKAELQLKVVNYHEDDYRQLFIFVNTNLSVEDASDRLDSFDTEWFLEADNRSNNSFNVKLRYV